MHEFRCAKCKRGPLPGDTIPVRFRTGRARRGVLEYLCTACGHKGWSKHPHVLNLPHHGEYLERRAQRRNVAEFPASPPPAPPPVPIDRFQSWIDLTRSITNRGHGFKHLKDGAAVLVFDRGLDGIPLAEIVTYSNRKALADHLRAKRLAYDLRYANTRGWLLEWCYLLRLHPPFRSSSEPSWVWAERLAQLVACAARAPLKL